MGDSEHSVKSKCGLPQVGFLRLQQVLQLIPVGKSTWWHGVKTGRYPQPIKLSKRTTAWSAADIDALIKNLASKQGGAQ